MPNHENPPNSEQDPNNSETSKRRPDRDADGDLIGPDGKKLPRVFPDIPCSSCNQHSNCIRAERCRGPVRPEVGADYGDTHYDDTHYQSPYSVTRSYPSAKDAQPGVSHLPDGGGIYRARKLMAEGFRVGGLGRVPLTEIHTMIQEAAELIEPALDTTDSLNARNALAGLDRAKEHAGKALELATSGLMRLYDYNKSLYR